MKVEVLYRSHRYEEFDTALTCPEPHRKEGVSILTDWNLYLGDLKGQGVILVQHWYDGTPPQQGENRGSFRFDDGTMVTAAVRRPGSAMLLVAPDELDGIVWLKKDGEKILWREGDDLINGERFFAMEQLCYSDAATVSINKRALAVFDYLKHVHPDDSDEIVAASMGYTPAAIQRIQDAELAQDDGYDDEEPDEDDTPEEEDGETEEKTAIPFDFA